MSSLRISSRESLYAARTKSHALPVSLDRRCTGIMSRPNLEATFLASALLAGPFDTASMLTRTKPLIEGRRAWLSRLVAQLVHRFGNNRPTQRNLIKYLEQNSSFQKARENEGFGIKPYLAATSFAPGRSSFADLQIPHWDTAADIAAWLKLEPSMLEWFADRKCLERRVPDGPLRHYRYQWVIKRGGNCRLIESPKPTLKEIQRRLLRELLNEIPVHSAAHGFRAGRSVQSFVQPHIGQTFVLKMDLKDFFPSIRPMRLTGLLMSLGYPENVARIITGLCSNCVPADAWNNYPRREAWEEMRRSEQLLRQPHFPQGAPTSPAIANICAYRLDCRLTGLAQAAGANYTRYSDDLVFSGGPDFKRQADRFHIRVAAIACSEGFTVNHHKTRMMSQSLRQQAAGVVLNAKPNAPRRDYEQLKAILHRSIFEGPASQNRDRHPDFRRHLEGRMNYIGGWNPLRRNKLQKLFDQINWEDDSAVEVPAIV